MAFGGATVLLAPVEFNWIRQLLGVKWGGILASIRAPVLGTALGGVVMAVSLRLLQITSLGERQLGSLALAMTAGGVAYFSVAIVLAPNVRHIFRLLRAMRASGQTGSERPLT